MHETQEKISHSLHSFIELIKIPAALHLNNHNNLRTGKFKKTLRNYGVDSLNQNHHGRIVLNLQLLGLKRQARRLIQKMQTPVRLLCFCYGCTAGILSLCATNRFDLKGRTPYKIVTNYTPDISEYTIFSCL